VTLPAADADALDRAAAAFPSDVQLLVPAGADAVTIAVRRPERAARRITIRFRSEAEGRRRATLAALDLVRRALGATPEEPPSS